MENNYQLSRIHNYINGLMSKEDMHALEREALEDPFLQDAIDGYRMQNGVDVKQISLLQQRLAARVAEQKEGRNKRFYSWQRLAIGMAAGVMFITVCSLLLLRYFPKAEQSPIKEIMISDAIYEYSVTPQNTVNTAIPVGGWEELHEKLNLSYSNPSNFQGKLLVEFEIDAKENTIVNLKVVGHNFTLDEELIDIIKHKIKWEGSKAQFYIEIYKISL